VPHRENPVIPSARIKAATRMVFTGYPSMFLFCFDAGVARGDSARRSIAAKAINPAPISLHFSSPGTS
jgi:hypothetical protein